MTQEVSTRLALDNGTTVLLAVTVSVSGSYRPAKISGDPDSCYEAEYPDVEILSAKVEDREDIDGNITEVRPPEPFDLSKLTSSESARLDNQVSADAVEAQKDADESRYEDEMERRTEARREEGD